MSSYGISMSAYGSPIEGYPPLGGQIVVDLRSDTISKPTPEMKNYMFNCEVGDDVYLEDPTCKELQEKAAKLAGKESAIFVPSGTMGNLIAIMAHCDRRDSEIIVGDCSHIILWEQGGASQIGQILMREIRNNKDGTFDLDEMEAKFSMGDDVHCSRTGLVCVENTHNYCGGTVLPIHWLRELKDRCQQQNIPVHMDGARVFNAAIYLGLPLSEVLASVDTVMFCLSKGLGAPVGSILAGPEEFIQKAIRIRKVLGGGMRQVGYLAGAGLFALDNHVERLRRDHEQTRLIAQAINKMKCPFIEIDLSNVQTNILVVNFSGNITAEMFRQRLLTITDEELTVLGRNNVCYVRVSSLTERTIRIVHYLNVTVEDIKLAIQKIAFVAKELS
uniref:Probable low-specificity L-threonine aldolase 1 n=1 Tax=Cacopsylla melanoneura TaxID=428564 RepID=A0A8D8QEF4_9HEMI